MKRIYEESHIDLMKEFLTKYLSSAIKPDIDLTLQATKHVQYLDKSQLDLLVSLFNVSKLSEEELSNYLVKLGFFSKVNIYEKRAIFTDYSRNTLLKVVSYNETLINYDLLKISVKTKDELKGLKSSLLAACKKLNKRIEKAHKSISFKRQLKIDSQKDRDPYALQHLDPVSLKSIETFFNPKCLRTIDYESIPKPSLNPVTEKTLNFRENTDTPSTRKYTIYDKVDNQNVILRRKKSLYLENSGPIDYHTDKRTKFNDISQAVKDLPKYTFDAETYRGFDIDEFVDEILFRNNGLEVPTESKYADDHLEFRKMIKGNVYFITEYLVKELRNLILSQDKYLSFSDANFLALEIRKVIRMPIIEYFYEQYLNSEEYRPIYNSRDIKNSEIPENEESIDVDEFVSANNKKILEVYEAKKQKKELKKMTKLKIKEINLEKRKIKRKINLKKKSKNFEIEENSMKNENSEYEEQPIRKIVLRKDKKT